MYKVEANYIFKNGDVLLYVIAQYPNGVGSAAEAEIGKKEAEETAAFLADCLNQREQDIE